MRHDWSMRRVEAGSGLGAWRKRAAPAAIGLDADAPRGRPFTGTIASRSLADFRLVRFRSSAHVLARATTGSEGPAHLLVSLQLDGPACLVQKERRVFVGDGAGAIGLLDTSRPFELSFPARVGRIFFYVPHTALRPRAPWLAQIEPLSLAPGNPVTSILREYMMRIADPGSRLDDASALALLDGFVNVLAIASALRRPAASDPRKARREAVCAFIRSRYGQFDLSPQAAARHFGISVRSIHAAFEGSGTSFGATLLEARLVSAAAALTAGEPRIADIAFAAGFGDLSHFNRSFKARFHATPGQWRRNAMGR